MTIYKIFQSEKSEKYSVIILENISLWHPLHHPVIAVSEISSFSWKYFSTINKIFLNNQENLKKKILVKYFHFHENMIDNQQNISWQSIKYFNKENLKNMQRLSWKIFPCDTHCIILWLLRIERSWGVRVVDVTTLAINTNTNKTTKNTNIYIRF